jgi:hypothetical protein
MLSQKVVSGQGYHEILLLKACYSQSIKRGGGGEGSQVRLPIEPADSVVLSRVTET